MYRTLLFLVAMLVASPASAHDITIHFQNIVPFADEVAAGALDEGGHILGDTIAKDNLPGPGIVVIQASQAGQPFEAVIGDFADADQVVNFAAGNGGTPAVVLVNHDPLQGAVTVNTDEAGAGRMVGELACSHFPNGGDLLIVTSDPQRAAARIAGITAALANGCTLQPGGTMDIAANPNGIQASFRMRVMIATDQQAAEAAVQARASGVTGAAEIMCVLCRLDTPMGLSALEAMAVEDPFYLGRVAAFAAHAALEHAPPGDILVPAVLVSRAGQVTPQSTLADGVSQSVVVNGHTVDGPPNIRCFTTACSLPQMMQCGQGGQDGGGMCRQ